MSVMGYNLPKVYEGRGPLEAASIGVELQPGDMAMQMCIRDSRYTSRAECPVARITGPLKVFLVFVSIPVI